jgi:exodeoxyribonuclease VII small subunit
LPTGSRRQGRARKERVEQVEQVDQVDQGSAAQASLSFPEVSTVARSQRSTADESNDLSKLSFEDILQRLAVVVEQLEDGEIPLEEALRTFEQGIALSRMGGKRLDEAERRIEVLLRDENGVQTRPLHDEEPDDE